MEVKISRARQRKEKPASINFDVQLKNAEAGKRSNKNDEVETL